ncbi:MAG TPA: hypothetical protein VN894_15290 [Polyangiaceae bacterium]|nr:hypothetical protein [Polyangiaceae bacterium]
MSHTGPLLEEFVRRIKARQALSLAGSGLLRGHLGMPKLVTALRAHDATLSSTSVDASKEAA